MSLPGEGLFALLQKSGIVPRSVIGENDPGNQFLRFLEDAYSSNRSFRKKFIKFVTENETAKNIAGYSLGVDPEILALTGNAYEGLKDVATGYDDDRKSKIEESKDRLFEARSLLNLKEELRSPYVNSVVYPA